MTRRTITVTLTEQQFRAIGGAVALAAVEWGEMGDDDEAAGGGYFGRQVQVLDRAWHKIRSAWWAGR